MNLIYTILKKVCQTVIKTCTYNVLKIYLVFYLNLKCRYIHISTHMHVIPDSGGQPKPAESITNKYAFKNVKSDY